MLKKILYRIIKFILGIPFIYILSLFLQHCVFLQFFGFEDKEIWKLQCHSYSYEEVVFVLYILWGLWMLWEIWNDLGKKENVDKKELEKRERSRYYIFGKVLVRVMFIFAFIASGIFGVVFFLWLAFSLAWGHVHYADWVAIGGPILSVLWTILSIRFFIFGKKENNSQKNP